MKSSNGVRGGGEKERTERKTRSEEEKKKKTRGQERSCAPFFFSPLATLARSSSHTPLRKQATDDEKEKKCNRFLLFSNAHDHDHPPSRLCEPKRLRGRCRSSAAAAATAAAAGRRSSGSSPPAATHGGVHGRGSSGGAARPSISDQDVRKEDLFFSSSFLRKSRVFCSRIALYFQQSEKRDREATGPGSLSLFLSR